MLGTASVRDDEDRSTCFSFTVTTFSVDVHLPVSPTSFKVSSFKFRPSTPSATSTSSAHAFTLPGGGSSTLVTPGSSEDCRLVKLESEAFKSPSTTDDEDSSAPDNNQLFKSNQINS